ncbi:hypothetical protein COOONC_18966, partial [Cooperia oncophora]
VAVLEVGEVATEEEVMMNQANVTAITTTGKDREAGEVQEGREVGEVQEVQEDGEDGEVHDLGGAEADSE